MQSILIIDDELFFREFISETLKREGYISIAASNGEEGLSILEEEKGRVSVVLLDMVMPDMDGLTALKKIKEIDAALPIIMMSAQMEQELVLMGLKNGAFDYLLKPLHTEELLLSVKKAYDHHLLVIHNEDKLRQLKNLELGAQRLAELTKGTMRMEAVVKSNKLLKATIDLIASVLEIEKVSMMLIEEKKRELRVVVTNGPNVDISSFPAKKIGEGIAGTVAEKGEAILVEDIKEAKGFKESEFSEQYKTGSFLCVPVRVLGKTIGVISVNDKLTGEPFNESDLAALATFSHQITLTLENVMINADMEQYIEKLTLLNEISKTLLSMVDPDEIFKDIVRKTREVLEVEACVLLLCEESSGELSFETGFSEKEEISLELTVKPGEGITGWVLENGEIAVIDNVEEDGRYLPQKDGIPDIQTRGMICAPMKIRNKTLGVLKALNKKEGEGFTERDREIMESIASQSSIALKNAWLYKNLVASVDDVAAANRELEGVNMELRLKVKELELLKKGKG